MKTIEMISNDARVWVYQCDRLLTDAEVASITMEGKTFISGWAAHGAKLNASFEIIYNLFFVLSVDEKLAMASGCSIDSSVHFIKSLEKKYNLNLFDRMRVAYRTGNEIKLCSLSEFEKLADQNMVSENTIVFNNMVTTGKDFLNNWEVPLKDSWQSRVLKTHQ
jgi:hypothetical protein